MYRQNSCVLQEIRVREHDCDVRFLTGSRNKAIRACAIKNKQFGPYLWPTRQNCLSYRKTGSANTTVTSGFLQEVEIRLLCAFAIKNMQFGPYLWPNRQQVLVNGRRQAWARGGTCPPWKCANEYLKPPN